MVSISEDLSKCISPPICFSDVQFSRFQDAILLPKAPSPASDLGGTASVVGNSTLDFSIWTPLCVAWVTLLSSAGCIATVGAGSRGYPDGP